MIDSVSEGYPVVLDEVQIERIAYEIALEHVCPSGRPPTTRYEDNAVATIRRLVKTGIKRALAAQEPPNYSHERAMRVAEENGLPTKFPL